MYDSQEFSCHLHSFNSFTEKSACLVLSCLVYLLPALYGLQKCLAEFQWLLFRPLSLRFCARFPLHIRHGVCCGLLFGCLATQASLPMKPPVCKLLQLLCMHVSLASGQALATDVHAFHLLSLHPCGKMNGPILRYQIVCSEAICAGWHSLLSCIRKAQVMCTCHWNDCTCIYAFRR